MALGGGGGSAVESRKEGDFLEKLRRKERREKDG